MQSLYMDCRPVHMDMYLVGKIRRPACAHNERNYVFSDLVFAILLLSAGALDWDVSWPGDAMLLLFGHDSAHQLDSAGEMERILNGLQGGSACSNVYVSDLSTLCPQQCPC